MDHVRQEIAKRKKHFAPSTCLTFDLTDDSYSIMTDYNKKVDLRPQWMINDSNTLSGKPHVDAVLHPEYRSSGILRNVPKPSSEQLQNVNLRKTGIRDSIDAEGMRTITNSPIPIEEMTIRNNSNSQDINHQVQMKLDNDERIPFVPPPPPLPKTLSSNSFRHTKTVDIHRPLKLPDRRYSDMDTPSQANIHNEMNDQKDREIRSLEAKLKRLEYLIQKPVAEEGQTFSQKQNEQLNSQLHSKQSFRVNTNNHIPNTELVSDVNLKKEFDKEELINNSNLHKWIDQLVQDKFERASQIDAPSKNESSFYAQEERKSRTKSKDDRSHSKHGRSLSKLSETSHRSRLSRTGSNSSLRSTAQSIKSVLFKRTEEEELHSEIDDEDIADINNGDTGFIDLTSQKFTIHGPFVDRELNVFHAICVEYQLAARISFAKRTPFSRTQPAHERVYALIGSDRRSSWTNRDSWTKATNDLQVLDFIFRKTIRSRSRKIRKPVMEIEHFTEGSILDSRRFYRIIRSIYHKRSHLVTVLRVEIDKFENIT